jgi:hypothetical protein
MAIFRLFITLPLVWLGFRIIHYFPFTFFGEKINTWWGSFLGGWSMFIGIGFIYFVHLFQRFGMKAFTGDYDRDKVQGGIYVPVMYFLLFASLFFMTRGIAILFGIERPFNNFIHFVSPYVKWLFEIPETSKI